MSEESDTKEVETSEKAEVKTEASGGEKTAAAGATEEKAEGQAKEQSKSYWGEDWRQKMAEHASAGDKKAFDRELKRLERFSDPTAVYGMYRELEGKFSQGGLTKIPGKDATEAEVKAWHKAIGVPEAPKAYVENLKLPEGLTLGDQDKALASDFAEAMHKVGVPQGVMDAAYGWYLKNEEARAAEIDRQDDENRREAQKALKEEYGPAFQRSVNAINSLFAYAPGGADKGNEAGLFNRLLAGRMADGKIIGDDPDMVRFLVAIAKEVNPVATVIEDGGAAGKGIDDEIAEIEKLMRTDRRAYDKDTQKQARYLELLEARNKHRARAA